MLSLLSFLFFWKYEKRDHGVYSLQERSDFVSQPVITVQGISTKTTAQAIVKAVGLRIPLTWKQEIPIARMNATMLLGGHD